MPAILPTPVNSERLQEQLLQPAQAQGALDGRSDRAVQPALDLIQSIYFSESSDLYQQLVIEDQSVDQLFGYFPNQTDPGMLIFAQQQEQNP